jgi:hypothetical protein
MNTYDIAGNPVTVGSNIKYGVAWSSSIHWKLGLVKSIEAKRAAIEIDSTKFHWLPKTPSKSYHEEIKRTVYLRSFDNTVVLK